MNNRIKNGIIITSIVLNITLGIGYLPKQETRDNKFQINWYNEDKREKYLENQAFMNLLGIDEQTWGMTSWLGGNYYDKKFDSLRAEYYSSRLEKFNGTFYEYLNHKCIMKGK